MHSDRGGREEAPRPRKRRRTGRVRPLATCARSESNYARVHSVDALCIHTCVPSATLDVEFACLAHARTLAWQASCMCTEGKGSHWKLQPSGLLVSMEPGCSQAVAEAETLFAGSWQRQGLSGPNRAPDAPVQQGTGHVLPAVQCKPAAPSAGKLTPASHTCRLMFRAADCHPHLKSCNARTSFSDAWFVCKGVFFSSLSQYSEQSSLVPSVALIRACIEERDARPVRLNMSRQTTDTPIRTCIALLHAGRQG